MSGLSAALDEESPNGRLRDSASRASRRFKICFVSETVHAGVGRHIVDAISELSARGHEIHLVYSPIRADEGFLSILAGLANVHCHAVPMTRAIGFGDIAAFRAIKAYVRNAGPFDIVHGHSSKGGGYARLLGLSGIGPILYSPHAFVTQSPATPAPARLLYRAIERALARLTDHVVCTSRGEYEHACELGISPERLAVIANGGCAVAAPVREILRAELGLAADDIVVGFAGRMEDQKAPERLIAATMPLFAELPRLTLLMIGDGTKRPLLEAELARTGWSDRVKWLGTVDARRYMPAMDIFALPSLYEGFAYVLIEALYAGLPIVSTPVGGSHESVESGHNGFIVPHGSAEAMATALRTLATDDGLRLRMAEASRNLAETFSIPRMVDGMEELYSSVLCGAETSRSMPPLRLRAPIAH